MNLLSDLIGNGATQAVAPQKIGPVRLYSPDLFQIPGGHVFDSRQRCATTVQAMGLQSIKRLISAKAQCKVAINQNVPAGAMHAEKRGSRTGSSNGNKRWPSSRRAPATQNLRKFFDGRCVEKRGERQLDIEGTLNLNEQVNSQR